MRSSQCMIMSMPFMQSSMYVKLRVAVPSPQILILRMPLSTASMTLRQMAAGAFSSSVPGAVRAIDVMETGDERLHTPFSPILLAEHFGHELFPAVSALGHRRVSVRFLQRADVGILL